MTELTAAQKKTIAERQSIARLQLSSEFQLPFFHLFTISGSTTGRIAYLWTLGKAKFAMVGDGAHLLNETVWSTYNRELGRPIDVFASRIDIAQWRTLDDAPLRTIESYLIQTVDSETDHPRLDGKRWNPGTQLSNSPFVSFRSINELEAVTDWLGFTGGSFDRSSA